MTLEELGNTLKDNEKKLQLREATLKGLGFSVDLEGEDLPPEKEQLHELLEASQTKLRETEVQLESTELKCKELEDRNEELTRLNQESESVLKERLAQAEDEIQILRSKLETQIRLEKSEYVQTGDVQVVDQEEHLVEDFERKSEALSQVLDRIAQVEVSVEGMLFDLRSTLFDAPQDGPLLVSQADWMLALEGEFWSQIAGKVSPEVDRSSTQKSLVEEIVAQEQAKVVMRRICKQSESDEVLEDFALRYKWLDNDARSLILLDLTKTLKNKLASTTAMVSLLKLEDERLLSLARASVTLGEQQKQKSDYLRDALKEACLAYVA